MTDSNRVRQYRQLRQWSQDELAQRAGVSRAAVSAIEQRRLSPSVQAALSLARVLGCSVEELFGNSSAADRTTDWAWPPSPPCRYWMAEIGNRRWRIPVEPTPIGEYPANGYAGETDRQEFDTTEPQRVLVLATCDPAVGLLASEYARRTPFRILPLMRSSRIALDLLKETKVHAAGVHLSADESLGNSSAVQERCGGGYRLLRVSVWQEGIAFAPRLKLRSVRSAIGGQLQWVSREPGSGAQQCLEELFQGKQLPRRVAPDHRGVSLAIRCGWAEAGICVQLASAEAGLGFLELRREAYDLCFPETLENDPRVRALIDVVQSSCFRRQIGCLPGYDVSTTGEVSSC